MNNKMSFIKRISDVTRTYFWKYYVKLEYRICALFNVQERMFSLKRGRLLLPLSPSVSGNRRRGEVYEPHTEECLRRYLEPGMTVIECGASLGYFTVLIAKLIGPAGKCYSFEPFPKYIRFLLKNIGLNQITNVQHVPKAVGNNSGTIQFSDEDRTSYGGISSLWNFHAKKDMRINHTVKREITVEVVPLSEFIRKNDLSVDFVFLDIEGCETLVFDDLLNSLEDDALPAVYFESHKGLYGQEMLDDIFTQFKARGFTKSTIDKNHFLMIPGTWENAGLPKN